MRRLILVVAALLALGVGGTAALASGAKEKPRAAVAVKARAGVLQSAATYLGLDRKALVKELRTGKSLAQIATARNTSVDVRETSI